MSDGPGGDWALERPTGAVEELHAPVGPISGRVVMVNEVEAPTLVLGSSQAGVEVAPGLDVVRRSSGGGAVLLRPDGVLWVDVLMPRGDPLWEDDVGRSTWWLGGVWSAALADLGVEAVVHRGPMEPGRWGGLACFAGIGPGEVLVGGRKSVGVSQRRDRFGARFQCAALLEWSGREMVRLLGLTPAEEAVECLESAAVALPVGSDPLLKAFLANLP
jgi:lipoate-protein ligase A